MITIEEMIAVMTAYKEGKKIEYKSRLLTDNSWSRADNPTWNWRDLDYRVKKEPKYRPYKNAKECFADVLKHGGWMRDKTTEGRMGRVLITRVNPDNVLSGETLFEFDEIAEGYVWVDDSTPCGVLEE